VSGYALGEPYGHGRSFQQTLRGATPAAGANFTFTVSGAFRSRLLACVFTLDTDANVANRYVTTELLLDDNTPFNLGAAAVTYPAATVAQRYCGSMYRGVAEWATNTDVLYPLLPVWIEEGQTIQIKVTSIQAGDTLTKIRMLFDQYPTSAHWFDASDEA
jgi:hypothetical protein